MKGNIQNNYKFIKFVSDKSESQEAFVDGKYLSHPDNKFKLTIFDDGSLNFTSVYDDKKINTDEAKRLLDLIDDKSLKLVKKGWIVNEITFVDAESKKMYLVVENKPYSALDEIFKEDTDSKKTKINSKQKSKLSELFSLFESEEEVDETEVAEVTVAETTSSKNHLEESFNKMKEEKKLELQTRLESLQTKLNSLKKQEFDVNKQLSSCKSEIELVQDRIKSMRIKEEPNGYYFFVSEMCNEKVELDEKTADIIKSAVDKVKTINSEAFMKLFEYGEYHITIYDSDKKVVKKLDDTLIKICTELGLALSDDYFIYRGELDWHAVVDTFVYYGYEKLSSKL